MAYSREKSAKRKLARLLKDAASKAISEGDPWAQHHIEKVPAERVIRHLYNPETQTWLEDETIVKMEREPFTHGAMRFCYRMKKRSPPPQSASNHRFHDYGWTRASNYVAKAYQVDGKIDTSEQAKHNVMNDILLQYESSHWSDKFNERDPPKKIVFIRAYAIEFPDREGKPWFAVERFISGTDMYGAAFTKHNTNSGYVDDELHRYTPQVFSAFSFYASKGERLVADIQGVGDLFTDPQVLSSDYRFGDGDLGPRGMALFFKSFRHNTVADAIGIAEFPLSKNELKHQSEYEDDVFSMSGDMSSLAEDMKALDRFAAMDLNRSRRQSVLAVPPKEIVPLERRNTERRSNQSILTREHVRSSITKSFQHMRKSVLTRTTSDVDEVQQVLALAKDDFQFNMKLFHRKESGEMMAKIKRGSNTKPRRPSLVIRTVSKPIEICEQTKLNLGKVHYQLAVLHGMNRFPEVVPESHKDEDAPHDAFSVLFHLCHAASLHSVPACLALGRLHAGLGTSVSPLLNSIVPIDFDAAKYLLQRAMENEYPPTSPKVAAGCILYQIYLDETATLTPLNEDLLHAEELEEHPQLSMTKVSEQVLMHLLTDILQLMSTAQSEREDNERHLKDRSGRHSRTFMVGDRVEANYFLEGTFYPGVVDSISDDGYLITVRYDDDGSTEALTRENVRLVIPPTATQTDLGGPLSDEEALGIENSDEKISMESYQLKAELAELIANIGDKEKASALYEEASREAMEAGKMKTATQWSLKASELLE
ncbi:alpha-kinase family protein [Nitzschia inconspicua]|uniref:Alpha-kinase family protein n=1 Tax=Nitzschia inconspicua TaxID=303405 RepID=A0A9K3LFZ3_9STRA|nr:alpha-kinase family protein [Nitzschia inconspicua]